MLKWLYVNIWWLPIEIDNHIKKIINYIIDKNRIKSLSNYHSVLHIMFLIFPLIIVYVSWENVE